MSFEVRTPPIYTYGNDYRFLVRHNLLRLFPGKAFHIEPVLLTRDHFEVVKTQNEHPV